MRNPLRFDFHAGPGRARRLAKLLGCAVVLAGLASGRGAVPSRSLLVEPGAVWLDTGGRPINAHGGGLLNHRGNYYWYGEVKQGRTYLPKVNQAWGGTRVLAGGVSCYSSTDLVAWKNEGVVLPSVADDPDHDLACENVIERPKVIYNTRTKKFVMWFHWDLPDYSAACSGVAVSDSPTGPFIYVRSFRPNAGQFPVNATEREPAARPVDAFVRDWSGGQMARDMTLFVDDGGKAYQFYAAEDNQTMHVSELSEDYLQPAGRYARIFVGRAMEAPAVFKRDGKYYLIASGCTGWEPNAARSAVAENIFGPWTELGNPCRGEGAELTFGCQSTYVLPVAAEPGQFIAIFDQWKKWDLEDSRYVWLPLAFDREGRPQIEWRARWSLSAAR